MQPQHFSTWPAASADHDSPLAFGPFQLFARRKLLCHLGEPVRLGARAIDLLLALIRQPGIILSQRELVAQVWPNTVVEDSNLRVHVAALRRALRDGEDGRCYISNEPGRGYRFSAQVRAVNEADAVPFLPAGAGAAPASPSPSRLRRLGACRRLSSIVGRADDLGAVLERLGLNRLVNIVGPGGVGKSTLAMAAAAALPAQFPGGVFHLDLALPHQAAHLGDELHVMAHALGAGGAQGAPCRVLLILDNCEHLIGAAAALAEHLLLSLPGLTLLVTSREPLQIDGEYLWRLSPLATAPPGSADPHADPALRLLLDRARKASNGFALDAANLRLAAAICQRLDGLPLALEMAAASIATLGLQGLHEQLDGLELPLCATRRNGPARHASLPACYDWSYRLLPAQEQALFQHLGSVAGSFTLAGGAALAGEAGWTPQAFTMALMALVAKSLVMADCGAAGTRFRLLGTARTYALAQQALARPAAGSMAGALRVVRAEAAIA